MEMTLGRPPSEAGALDAVVIVVNRRALYDPELRIEPEEQGLCTVMGAHWTWEAVRSMPPTRFAGWSRSDRSRIAVAGAMRRPLRLGKTIGDPGGITGGNIELQAATSEHD